MGCCLGKGDTDELSNRQCPVGYCISKVDYTEAMENNSCEQPVGSDVFNQDCYQMTNECNNLFKGQCTWDFLIVILQIVKTSS